MILSRFVAIPLLAGLSLAVSLVLLPIEGNAPASGPMADHGGSTPT